MVSGLSVSSYPRKMHFLDQGVSFYNFLFCKKMYASHLKIGSQSYFSDCPNHSACITWNLIVMDGDKLLNTQFFVVPLLRGLSSNQNVIALS